MCWRFWSPVSTSFGWCSQIPPSRPAIPRVRAKKNHLPNKSRAVGHWRFSMRGYASFWLLGCFSVGRTGYTICAVTYHLSTPHILSIFEMVTSAGRAVGAVLWRSVVRKSIRYTLAGASMIACLSSLMPLGFDLFGLVSNPGLMSLRSSFYPSGSEVRPRSETYTFYQCNQHPTALTWLRSQMP